MSRAGLLALGLLSCLGSTEIELDIHTDVPCSDWGGVGVAVGTPGAVDDVAFAAETTACDDAGHVGSLVVIPNGAIDDEVGIRITEGFGKPVESCTSPFGAGCIVARRSLRYLPHTPLYLPVVLSARCAGVPCDTISTCQDGQCVPAEVPDSGACVTPTGCADAGAPLQPFGADCGDMSGAQFGAPDPMTAVCPRHLSRTPAIAPATLPALKWTHDLGAAPILSSPVVTQSGLVVVGSGSADIYVFDVAGNAYGTITTGTVVGGNGGIAADGTVVIAAQYSVFGVDPTTRSHVWAMQDAGGSDVTIGPGQLAYYGQGTGLVVRQAGTGQELHRVACASTATSWDAPAIAPDGTIYLSSSAVFCAIDPATFTVKWTEPAGGRGTPLVGVDGTTYVSEAGYAVVARSAAVNNPKWTFPTATSDLVALGPGGEIVAGTTTGLVGLAAPSGAVVWKWTSTDAITGSILVDGTGIVIATTQGGDVVAIDPKSPAAPRWQLPVPGTALGAILAGDGTVLVRTSAGTLLAYR